MSAPILPDRTLSEPGLSECVATDEHASVAIQGDAFPVETPLQPGSIRELATFAIPLILSSGSLTLTHTIDRLFLTWYSTDALAAATPSGALHWTLIGGMVGTINYVNTFISQYEGANQKGRVGTSVWQGIILAVMGGILFAGFIPLAPLIFRLAGHEAEVQRLESQFFQFLCLGAVPTLLTIAMSCFYSGRGKTRVVMYVDFILAVTNIALDPLLIFGVGPFPRWGIAGAAIATDIAYCVAAGVYLILSLRDRDFVAYGFWKCRRWDPELFRRLLRYGLPTGLQMTAEVSAFAVFVILVGHLGKQALAASNLAFSINALSFIPMLGLGTAVMMIVGRRIGEGRPQLAIRTVCIAAATTSLYMLLFTILFLGFPQMILRPFITSGAEAEMLAIRDQTVILLRFVTFYMFFDGVAIVFAFAVRGAGDTRFPFVYTLITAYLIMVLPTSLVVVTGRGGLMAAWIAASTYICCLGIGMARRFFQGRWKSMSVIRPVTPR